MGSLMLAVGAGAAHGFAYGDAVTGAEATPVAAYLCGLALAQACLMLSAYFRVLRLRPLALKKLTAVSRLLAAALAMGGLWLLWSRSFLA